MKGSVIIKSALLALIICMLCACSPPRVGFTMHTGKAPDTLDPQIAVSPSEISSALHLYKGLFRKSPSGKIEADAAADYTLSADGLVYTITLKDNQFWHTYKQDGKEHKAPLTAADFVFGIQRVFDKATKSPYQDKLSNILNAPAVLDGSLPRESLACVALDDKRLQITLARPDPLFIDKLCCAGAMPCNEEFFVGTHGAYGLSGKTSLGNGDFTLTSWVREEGIGLKKLNSAKGSVNHLRLILPLATDKTTAAERLEDGTTDGELVRGYVEDSRFSAQYFATTVWALCLNQKKPAFANASVRQGLMASFSLLNLELDDKSLMAAKGIVPPSITMLDKSYREMAGDISADTIDAPTTYRQGLEALGLSQLADITVLVPDSGPYQELFDEINQQWQKDLGAFFKIQAMPLSEIETAVANGEYDIAMLPISQGENDAGAVLDMFTTGSLAQSLGYNSYAYKAALDAAYSTSDGVEQARLFAQAERTLLNDAPIIPLFYETTTFLSASWAKDIILSPYGPVIDVSYAYEK